MQNSLLTRLATILLAVGVATAFASTTVGCAHPYSGKPEKLKKPRKKKRPEPTVEETKAKEVVWDEECRTNFYDDKKPGRRNPRAAEGLVKQADALLLEADNKEGADRVNAVVDALSKLDNALAKDVFNPEATYKMAVAYALVRKKGCALRLLERLNELQKMEEGGVGHKAKLAIKRAVNDMAFDGFRKDADAAMGE